MNLVAEFIRNPVKVAVGVFLVVLFGGIAITKMPMQLTPEVQMPVLSITSRWRGAGPREIEQQIIQPQEEVLKTVEGVLRMTSESSPSMARIILRFAAGTNISEALLKVNTRLQQIHTYPEDAREPVISSANLADTPVALFILRQTPPSLETLAAFEAKHPETKPHLDRVRKVLDSSLALIRLRDLAAKDPVYKELLPPPVDATKLRDFAEDFIEGKIERLDGVADSEVHGGFNNEMHVIVDPQRLASRQITIQKLRAALQTANRDTAGGDFSEGKRRYLVRTVGQFQSPEDIGAVIIDRPDGIPVYVRDIAEVKMGYSKPEGLVRLFGDSSLAVSVRRENNANVLEVMARVKEAVAKLNAGILQQRGLTLTQVHDETGYIYDSIQLVTENIASACILTVLTLLVFLRSLRCTLAIGVAIPVSIIGTFWMLYLMGRSLNVVSLAGLAFAVGMLVDNAIVVLENIYRHFQMGKNGFDATVDGTAEVWGAVFASTATTLAVFLPVLFIQEEVGQLFRDIALAISCAVGLSMVVSVVVIPPLAAWLLRIGELTIDSSAPAPTTCKPRGLLARAWYGLFDRINRFGAWFVNSVDTFNVWLLSGTARQFAFVGVTMIAAVWLSKAMVPKVEYLPVGNQNLISGNLLVPPAYNMDQLLAVGKKIETDMRPYWDVDPDVPDSSLKYPKIKDLYYVARNRGVQFGLRAADPAQASRLVPLAKSVAETVPGAMATARQNSLFGISGGRIIDVEIRGPDLEQLMVLGREVMGMIPGVIPNAQAIPRTGLELGSPELNIIPRREQAADMGMSADELGYAVDALVDGAYATDYFVNGDRMDLTIQGASKSVKRTQDLGALAMATPTGDLVPLTAIATVKLGSGPQQINHSERERAVIIEVSPPMSMPLEEAIERIENMIAAPMEASGKLQGLYSITLTGTADKLQQAWRALRMNLLLALLITYLLMAALFESWLYPISIMFSVPLGAVGGFAGLWLINLFVDQPLDVVTMLGFIILIGTVVNNPILIVHQALNNIRNDGMSTKDAILTSVHGRIRPIFMTTATTVLGLLPLVVCPGSGSELYRGLGGVVLGGLVASTLITLVIVPSVLYLTIRAKEETGRLLRYQWGV